MKDDRQKTDPKSELPDDVADAWAAVLLDVYEKRKRNPDAASTDRAASDDSSRPEQDTPAPDEEE